jgi:hypothetical protein
MVVGLLTTCGLLDGTVHIVLGHVHAPGVLDGHLQAGIGIRVGSTGLHGHGDLLTDPRKELAQLRVTREDLVLAFLENATHVRSDFEIARPNGKARKNRLPRSTTGPTKGDREERHLPVHLPAVLGSNPS